MQRRSYVMAVGAEVRSLHNGWGAHLCVPDCVCLVGQECQGL